MRRVQLLMAVLLALGLLAMPAAAQQAPVLPVVDLLPPLVPDDPAADHADLCGDDGLTCVRFVEEQLARWEAHFGCDHRAVFPTVYRMLTAQTRMVLEDDPSFFDDPAGLGFEALAFYDLYEEMILAHLAGEAIPDAWQVVMDVAAEGDWTGGHDMLLAINAHVQRDMPFAVAEAGLVLPDGSSRKDDHDRFNQVLAAAYDPIVREVGRRYDPLMTDVSEVPIAAELGAMQMVAGWREGVWRNAEGLVASAGTPFEAVVIAEIETHAHAWAEAMANGEVPGRRALRDAHCQAFLASQDDGTEEWDEDTGVGGDASGDAGSTDPALPATGAGGWPALAGVVVLGLWIARRNGHTRLA
jgi:hypothetical protein